MNILNGSSLILASKSPRRKELLESLGVPFEIHPSDILEEYPSTLSPFLVPEFLAQKKARDVHKHGHYPVNYVILGSDSIVIQEGRIFEKPADHAEAFNMLAHLSGKRHTVVTGVCLIRGEKEITFSGKSTVEFRPMDKAEIDHYIEQYQPFDKAGAYGIQDWIGMAKISSIEGTYTNIMGLPTDLVYEGLKSICS